jgi:hypothetical protein
MGLRLRLKKKGFLAEPQIGFLAPIEMKTSVARSPLNYP